MARLEDFYRWSGPRPEVDFGGRRCLLPLWYHDNEFTSALHTADHDAVAAALPTDLLRPARWVDGRALVSVASFRYRAITVDLPGGGTGTVAPYGEVSVAALVTRGPAMRLLPVLRPRVQVFVLHLPVTTAQARDGGNGVWGFPKFVADIDVVEAPARRQVTVSADGADELGPHPVGRRLAELDLSPTPVALFHYLAHRSILPAGVPVGPAEDHHAHAGAERPSGRYTVRYPGTPPLDVQTFPAPVQP